LLRLDRILPQICESCVKRGWISRVARLLRTGSFSGPDLLYGAGLESFGVDHESLVPGASDRLDFVPRLDLKGETTAVDFHQTSGHRDAQAGRRRRRVAQIDRAADRRLPFGKERIDRFASGLLAEGDEGSVARTSTNPLPCRRATCSSATVHVRSFVSPGSIIGVRGCGLRNRFDGSQSVEVWTASIAHSR